MASTRLAGHGLQSEGKPYALRRRAGVLERTDGKVGVGLCECGMTSHPLDSDGLRKRWHRDHKEKIRNGS